MLILHPGLARIEPAYFFIFFCIFGKFATITLKKNKKDKGDSRLPQYNQGTEPRCSKLTKKIILV